MDDRDPSLKDKAQSLPPKPGIYFFLGKDKAVLYIGKARSLQDRIRSYFLPTSDPKVFKILAEAVDIDYILTDSAREAAFLENNFIQQYQPKFNERLKDDKSFPYLKLTVQEAYPGIYLTRRVEADGARYFGPFNPALQARKTIRLINRFFGIRDCRETIPSTRGRPCLQHDLGLCTAPCTGFIAEIEYRERSENALLFLEGKVDDLLRITRQRMKKASERLDFEQAGKWRDLIFTLEQIKEKPRFISTRAEDKDIFGFASRENRAAVYAFLMRRGKVVRSEGRTGDLPEGQTAAAFLREQVISIYREGEDLPGTIMLPFALEDADSSSDVLAGLHRQRVLIKVPQRGKNRRLVELAERNAALLLDKRPAQDSPLQEIRSLLGLKAAPHIIEGFDISNTGGQESVGSRVVFRHGLPDKQSYRKFRIRSVAGPNDVASLQEVLHRRFSRISRSSEDFPGLVLVDGGKGQFNAARTVLESLELGDTPLVSLAKREEIVFSERFPQGLSLDRTSPALRLLQNIRDEAHRFAIAFHRRQRTKKSFASLLDGVPGIGPKRKSRLQARYKSIRSIREAPLEELAPLIGTTAAVALKEALDS